MNKIKLAVRSRTFWTIVIIFAYNGLEAITPMFSGTGQIIVNAVLGILAANFRVNPKAEKKMK